MKIDLIKHLIKAIEHTEMMTPMMPIQLETEDKSGEYGGEGGMARSDLLTLIRNAQELHDMLTENQDLPEHVQSKIVLASDYIVDAANYMKSEMQHSSNPQMPMMNNDEYEVEEDEEEMDED